MSYQRPPTKSPYGDTDFTYEDNWSKTQGAPAQNFGDPNQGFGAPVQGYGTPSQNFGHQAPANQVWSPNTPGPQAGNFQPNMQQPINPNTTQAPPISHEDILFLNACKMDSYVKRVLPGTAIASACYYFYNKKYNLPHKASRYIILAMTSFVVGRISYIPEFRRRVSEQSPNTPFMQAVKQAMGQGGLNSAGLNWDQYGFTGVPVAPADPGELLNRNPAADFQPLSTPEQGNLDNEQQSQPQASYNDLRAKNRGYIR